MTSAHTFQSPEETPSEPAPSHRPLRVLVVDDHPRIREPLARYLRREGLEADTAGDLMTMRHQLELRRFDVVVLDVMLPDGDGSIACADVRESSGAAVLLLTARDSIDDRVNGLERGADDYIVKPFEPRELLARIRSVVRRTSPATSERPAPPRPATSPSHSVLRQYTFDGWLFDASRASLRTPQDEPLALSDAESTLLEVLLCHANAVLSREQLLDLTRTQGRDGELAYDRTIDRQISRLRHKLQHGSQPAPMLRTVRGGGYTLAAQVERLDG